MLGTLGTATAKFQRTLGTATAKVQRTIWTATAKVQRTLGTATSKVRRTLRPVVSLKIVQSKKFPVSILVTYSLTIAKPSETNKAP